MPGTIVFHNFLALYGVLDALERSGTMADGGRLDGALLVMAAVALTATVSVRRTVARAA
jgi:hypothetical protein